MQITSRQNPLIKEIRRAITAGEATADGLIAAEGPHLVEEGLRSAWTVSKVLMTPAARDRFAGTWPDLEDRTILLPEEIFSTVSATEHSQGVLALLRPKAWTWDDVTAHPALVLVLDGVRDPGNAGTLVRSAEAFGATGVLFGRGSVHIANSKFLRATAGSIFRLPFLGGLECNDLLQKLQSAEVGAWSLAGAGETLLTEADFGGPAALIIGNEGAGVSECWRTGARSLRIPTVHVESLNAGIAGSLALFEAFRQRTMKAGSTMPAGKQRTAAEQERA